MKVFIKRILVLRKVSLLLFQIVFFVLCPFSGQTLYAQNTAGVNGKISGTVLDSEELPVSYASIVLIEVSSGKTISGASADIDGKFVLAKIPTGSYKLTISSIGFETQTLDSLLISEANPELTLPTIKLGFTIHELNEVVVTGERPLIEEKVDRTVYNAENDETNKGGDATDVLKKVPMLSVDMDGNVSMRGNQNIKILINDRPSSITAGSVADALKQIPADLIKSVEVITSPSSKYDAEGSAGIINIVLKQNTLEGLFLNVNGSAGLRGSNLGLNGNLKKNKMTFSLGGWGRAGYNVHGKYTNTQDTRKSDGSVTENIQSASTRNSNSFGRYQLGWDYDINKKNFITSSIKYSFSNNNSFQDGLKTETYSNNVFQSSGLRDINNNNLSGTIDVNFGYTHNFEKPQREFKILGLYSRNNRDNNFYSNILDVNNGSLQSRLKNVNHNFNGEYSVQADFQTPVKEKQLWETGAKSIFRKVNSKYDYFAAGSSGDFYPLSGTLLSNEFNYYQNVTSAYLTSTFTLPSSIMLKVGSRYEYTSITATFRDNTTVTVPSYGVLIPGLNISKKMESGNMIKASYNRRIQRPSIQFLNPNIQVNNPLSVTIGNPTLRPELTNNFDLSYNSYIKKSSLNITGFVRNTNNSIQSIRDTIPGDSISGRIRTTYRNIGKESAYGINVFSNIKINSKLTLNGSFEVFYAVLSNNVPDHLYRASNEGWVASGRVFGTYNFTEKWGLQAFAFFRGRQVQLQGYQGASRTYSLSIKRSFKEGKGSIGFGAENFFTPSMTIHNSLDASTITQRNTNVMYNMNFKINFSYSIGKMTVDGGRRKKSISNDDLKGGGNDMDMNDGGGLWGGFADGMQSARVPLKKLPPADTAAKVKIEGAWNYLVESSQKTEGTFIIKKEGDKYSGTINNKRSNKDIPLTSVSVHGNELSFTYEITWGGNQMSFSVKGIIKENSFEGNTTAGQFGTFPVKANRAEEGK